MAARAYGAAAFPSDYDALEALKVEQSSRGPTAFAAELGDYSDFVAYDQNMAEMVELLRELAVQADAHQTETLSKILHRDVSFSLRNVAHRMSHRQARRFRLTAVTNGH